MSREARLRAGQAFDPSRFVPFVAAGRTLGYVRRDHAEMLRAYDTIFRVGEDAIGFRNGLDSAAARSAVMAQIARELSQQGRLSAWRDETYDIRPCEGAGSTLEDPALFALERCAVRFFGFTARAVHVNGLTRRQGRMAMWIARRSPQKAIDPGMLDNLVGGGLASAHTVTTTLVKEASEEAGIPESLARTARAAGTVYIRREVPDGLHAETIYVHDLVLPEDFVPVNQDGEVAEFRLLALEEVARELEGDAPYTVDAALVALDCLRRHGVPVA